MINARNIRELGRCLRQLFKIKVKSLIFVMNQTVDLHVEKALQFEHEDKLCVHPKMHCLARRSQSFVDVYRVGQRQLSLGIIAAVVAFGRPYAATRIITSKEVKQRLK